MSPLPTLRVILFVCLFAAATFASTLTTSLGTNGTLQYNATYSTGSCPNGPYNWWLYDTFVYINSSGVHTSLGGNIAYYNAGNCGSYNVPNGPTPTPTLVLKGSTYTITFTPGDGSGTAVYNPTSVLPTPPATATTFSTLQDAPPPDPGSWQPCTGSCASHSTNNGTGTSHVSYGNTPKKSSGGSLEFMNTGNGDGTWDVLYYRHLGNSWNQNSGGGTNTLANISNMLLDFWFWPQPQSGDLVAYEFDPDLGTGSVASSSWAYKASLQCQHLNSQGTAVDIWRVWSTAQSGWVSTTLPCNFGSTGANAWNHIQLWATFNQSTHQYTYQSLVVNGATIFSPSSPPSSGSTFSACGPPGTPGQNCSGFNTVLGSNVNVEMQIDNVGNIAGTNVGYYDLYTLTIW